MIVRDERRYITIAEYCDYIGISKQAVYSKLNKSLKPYVVEIDRKKYIDSVIFTEYHNQEKDPTEEVKDSQGYSMEFNPISQGQSREEVKDSQDNSTPTVKDSQGYSMEFNPISQGQSRKEVKDSQDNSTSTVKDSQGYSMEFLKFLQDQIAEKDKQIALLQKQTEDLQQSNREKDTHILEQANKITILLEQSQELQRNSQYLLATTNKNEQANIEKAEKKGFFKRLFGR